MTQLILLQLDHPEERCELFLDCFCLLFSAHLLETYAPSLRIASRFRGGLPPWQKRRGSGIFPEYLDGGLRLAALAGACGASVRHFPRGLRQTFGTAPRPSFILPW